MATHSSVLAWRIPRTVEPGGLLSVGSHRVRHDWSDLACMHALEMEMATHSSILAWRIPGTEEPGGLLSVGSHRVRHAWIDLAAAAGDNTLQVFGNVNCPITGDLGAHGKLQSPLPSVKNTTDPLRSDFFLKINISFYLFICTASSLQHVGSC